MYSQGLNGEIYHYRDGYGLEADIVIRLDDGRSRFLMILTAGEYGYKRPDGVYVIPIGCLRD